MTCLHHFKNLNNASHLVCIQSHFSLHIDIMSLMFHEESDGRGHIIVFKGAVLFVALKWMKSLWCSYLHCVIQVLQF